jgi:fatty-acyl-CoA synthase
MTALVTDPVRYWAANVPDQPAIVFDGQDPVTYAELDAWTDNVAHFLVEHGVEPGDRVGMIGPNSLAWAAGALGALKVGAIVAPYNNRMVANELGFLVTNSEPTVVLADPANLSVMGAVDVDVDFELVPLERVTELRPAPRRPFPRYEGDPDDVAVLIYTSGTTANPKGVIYTHRTIHAFVYEWGLMEPVMRQGVRMLFVLSLGGAPGLPWAILHMTIRGGTLFMEKGFEPAVALRRLTEERIQVFMGVPVLFEQIALLPEFADADLSALDATTVGGAKVPLPTLEAWVNKGVALRQIYGMTELGGTSIANTREQAMTRPESVGRDSLFTRHRVVRPDGTDCDPGEPGEIIAKGPAVTPGYWRNEEATAEVLRDGWFHSGDIGVFDDEGYLRMVDRMKDMIITGGYNVAPSEIEGVIFEIDGVEEAAVIPVDDEKFGETVAAIIKVGKAVDPSAVVAHCNERLTGYKVPRYVEVVDEPLPRMASGKIAKRELREKYAHMATTHERLR